MLKFIEQPESKIHDLYIISVFIYLRGESSDLFKKGGGGDWGSKEKQKFF